MLENFFIPISHQSFLISNTFSNDITSKWTVEAGQPKKSISHIIQLHSVQYLRKKKTYEGNLEGSAAMKVL